MNNTEFDQLQKMKVKAFDVLRDATQYVVVTVSQTGEIRTEACGNTLVLMGALRVAEDLLKSGMEKR